MDTFLIWLDKKKKKMVIVLKDLWLEQLGAGNVGAIC